MFGARVWRPAQAELVVAPLAGEAEHELLCLVSPVGARGQRFWHDAMDPGARQIHASTCAGLSLQLQGERPSHEQTPLKKREFARTLRPKSTRWMVEG